jgi:hypothetical protein
MARKAGKLANSESGWVMARRGAVARCAKDISLAIEWDDCRRVRTGNRCETRKIGQAGRMSNSRVVSMPDSPTRKTACLTLIYAALSAAWAELPEVELGQFRLPPHYFLHPPLAKKRKERGTPMLRPGPPAPDPLPSYGHDMKSKPKCICCPAKGDWRVLGQVFTDFTFHT